MDDRKLESLLQTLSIETAAAKPGADFRDMVWQRIGELSKVRERRRSALLSLAIFAVGLGAGMEAALRPAYAEDAGYTLAVGADLSPSALLHVTP